MKDINKTIGFNLRRLRTVRGHTLNQLADFLGVTYQQVQKYESGANRLSSENMFKLCGLMGVEPQAFFNGLNNDHYRTVDEGIMADLQKLEPQVRSTFLGFLRAVANSNGKNLPAHTFVGQDKAQELQRGSVATCV